MSLLLFEHQREQVVLVTDTLATTLNGEPFLFLNKCWPVPHMKMVMAGTGFAPLHDRWYRALQTSLLARDIGMCDHHAPAALRGLWAELLAENPGIEATATVYHFGEPEGRTGFVRYVYRSDSGFESELSAEPGFGVKPVPSFQFDPPGSVEELIALAIQIRAEQDALPLGSRIHIGGELILTGLHQQQVVSSVIYRFPDYDEMWEAMNRRLQSEA